MVTIHCSCSLQRIESADRQLCAFALMHCTFNCCHAGADRRIAPPRSPTVQLREGGGSHLSCVTLCDTLGALRSPVLRKISMCIYTNCFALCQCTPTVIPVSLLKFFWQGSPIIGLSLCPLRIYQVASLSYKPSAKLSTLSTSQIRPSLISPII